MPATSVPPSKKNPVGSFDNADSDSTTDSPTIINKIDADDSEQDDTPNAITEDQKLLEKNSTDDEENIETGSKDELGRLLQQKKAGRKKASTDKEFQQLLMNVFQKVEDWHSRYTGLLSTSGMLVTDEQKSEISDYIMEYISIIRSNCNETDQDTPQNMQDAERIWALFLILFESAMIGQGESVVGEFRNWIDMHLPLDLAQLDSTDEVNWEFAQRLILNGDTKNAGKYFAQFVDSGIEYQALSDLLLQMPELSTFISTSYETLDWTEDWDIWHCDVESVWNKHVESKQVNEEDDNAAGLLSVMKILMGDKKMIQKTEGFGQKCLATLMYSDPRSHQFNMQKIANQLYDPILDGDFMSVLLYNMLDGDFDPLLGLLDDNLWMQVHFGHLLLATGYIPSEADIDDEQQDTLNTQEQVTEPIYYLFKLYAMEISQKYCMWTEAMECIMVCKSNRNIWIKELLGEPPLASEDLDYLKDVLKFCTAHQLRAIEATLYSAIGKRYESGEDFVCAAMNYADANDIDALDKMANEHLDLYLVDGTLRPVVTESKYIELVDQSCPYSFYRRYYELKVHSKDMQNDEAYQSTVALLKSLDYVPQKYRVVLLIDLFGISKGYSSTKKQDYLLMLQQLDKVVKDVDQKSFISVYYQRTHPDTKHPLSTDTIIDKLRQRFGFCFAADMLSL